LEIRFDDPVSVDLHSSGSTRTVPPDGIACSALVSKFFTT
jgi:hypothetical protein